MYVCMYVCMYVRMYVCTYICMYIHIYVILCMYVCMYVCIYVCICMCVHMYIYNIMYVSCIIIYYFLFLKFSCKQKLHRAHCLLPVPAAHILLCHRDLISCIVHAFCDRDKEDMKVGVVNLLHELFTHLISLRLQIVCFISHLRIMKL